MLYLVLSSFNENFRYRFQKRKKKGFVILQFAMFAVLNLKWCADKNNIEWRKSLLIPAIYVEKIGFPVSTIKTKCSMEKSKYFGIKATCISSNPNTSPKELLKIRNYRMVDIKIVTGAQVHETLTSITICFKGILNIRGSQATTGHKSAILCPMYFCNATSI